LGVNGYTIAVGQVWTQRVAQSEPPGEEIKPKRCTIKALAGNVGTDLPMFILGFDDEPERAADLGYLVTHYAPPSEVWVK